MSMDSPLTARIAALQQAGSALALLQATQELASCADASAAPVLVEVLGFNNPGAAVAAVEGLISLGTAAVDALLQLDPENYGARAWAVRALAGIGDVRGLELLLDALGSDVAASVRRAAAKGLGQLQLDELPLTNSKLCGVSALEPCWPPPATASGWCATRWQWGWSCWQLACPRQDRRGSWPNRACSHSRKRLMAVLRWCRGAPSWPFHGWGCNEETGAVCLPGQHLPLPSR